MNTINKGKLVSVIIPVCNRLDFFGEALQSIRSQTYRPIEVVVVDDTTDTESRVKLIQIVEYNGMVEDGFSVSILRNIDRKGAPSARNLGFSNAKGEYIQFFDSDDILLSDKLDREVEVLEENTDLDLVYSKAQFVDENLNRVDKYWGMPLSGRSADYFQFSWQTMCPLYRRSAISIYGLWDESLRINQDWEFCVRYLISGARVHFIDEVHSLFRKHSRGNIGTFRGDVYKVISKWESTWKVYSMLVNSNRIDSYLKRVFIKRWTYIMLITSGLNEREEFIRQLHMVKGEAPLFFLWFGPIFRYSWISRSVLMLLGYDRA